MGNQKFYTSVVFLFPLPIFTRKKHWIFKKILDFQFLMNLYALRCPEHDLVIFLENCLCDSNLMATLTQELNRVLCLVTP